MINIINCDVQQKAVGSRPVPTGLIGLCRHSTNENELNEINLELVQVVVRLEHEAVGLELKVAVDLCLVEFIGSEAELDLVSAANGNVNSKLLAFVSSLNSMALDFMAPGLTSHGL